MWGAAAGAALLLLRAMLLGGAGVAAEASFASNMSSDEVPPPSAGTPLVHVRITSRHEDAERRPMSPPRAALGLDDVPDGAGESPTSTQATRSGPAHRAAGVQGAAMAKRGAPARRPQAQQQGAPRGGDARAEQARAVRAQLLAHGSDMGLFVGNARNARPAPHPGDPWQKLPSNPAGRGTTPSAASTPLYEQSSPTASPAAPDSFRLEPLQARQVSLAGETEHRFKRSARAPVGDGDAERRSIPDHAPFEKKPQYPVLVNFTAVAETGAPDGVRRRARLSNKTKISRSLFGVSADESLLARADSSNVRLDSTAALEAVKDFAVPSHSELPGKNMTEREAEMWLDRWVDSLNVEEDLFTSTSTFAEIKLQEMLEADSISELRKGFSAPADSADLKPNAFRTAVCFLILDRMLPRLGSFAPMVKKLREEIAKSVYTGLNAADLRKDVGEMKSKEMHYAFQSVPFFVDNVRLVKTMQSMKDRFNEAQERTRVAEEQATQLREQVASLEARLCGLQMQLQVNVLERNHDKEDFHKRETMLLAEMQQLRDKAVASALAAAQSRAQASGGGADTNAPAQDSTSNAISGIVQLEMPQFGNQDASALDLKEATDFLMKCGKQAMRMIEDDVEQCSRQVQLWQRAMTSTHNVSLLITKPGETLASLSRTMVPDLLLKWVEYQVKQCRRQVVVDGPNKPNNLTVDMADGLMLTQVVHHVMPKNKQASYEELMDIIKSTPKVRARWCGQKMSELTGDSKWMTNEFSSTKSGGRMELLLLLMITRPNLDGELFGEGKELQRLISEVHDRFEVVKDNFSQFNTALESAVHRGEKLNIVSVELLLRAMEECRVEMDKLAQHLPVVAEEILTVEHTGAEVLGKVAFYLQQRSNQKLTQAADECIAEEEEEPEMIAKQDVVKDQRKQSVIIAPVKKAETTVDLLPGKLAQLKGSLTKPVLHIISNLILEKLQDAMAELMYEEQVRILENVGETTVMNFDLLRRTFRQYCKIYKSINMSLVQSGGAAMSMQSWQLLLADIKVVGPAINCPKDLLSPKKAEEAFTRANFVKNPKNGRYEVGHGKHMCACVHVCVCVCVCLYVVRER